MLWYQFSMSDLGLSRKPIVLLTLGQGLGKLVLNKDLVITWWRGK